MKNWLRFSIKIPKYKINEKNLATILLWYGDTDNSNAPSMQDITDDLIQNYYTQVLDKFSGTVSGLQVAHKKDSSAVYGRYEVTWTAAATRAFSQITRYRM